MSELACQLTVFGVPIRPDNSNNLLGVGVGICGVRANYWWKLDDVNKMPLCEKHAHEGNKVIEPIKSVYDE